MPSVYGALQKGFTLVELVIVIVLLSVLGIMTSSYIGTGVDIYSDVAERDKELNSIRFVMERLRREVGNALPNSAVVGGNCLTFTPIVASTVYGDDFPISSASATTGTIFPISEDISGAKATVYLLSESELTSEKVQQIADYSADQDTVTFVDNLGVIKNVSFPLGSPAKRVYFIRDNTTYCFSGTNLYRRVNSGSDVLMAEDISGSFTASSATLQRNGLVQVSFELTFDGQEVPIEQTLHIYNTP